MDTYFAPAERAAKRELVEEIDVISNNPVITGVLDSVSGLLAVVDDHRQIVAVNDALLQSLNIDNPADVLGLRPGEVLQCVHASDAPAGCGTTKFCSTCGAAIAMVTSLEKNIPAERICALTTKSGTAEIDVALLVKSHPIEIDNKRFLLLFLQNVTQQEQRSALERTFFHDVNNMLAMMMGASELLVEDNPSDLAKAIHQGSLRLHNEIAIQRCLSQGEVSNYQPLRHEISTEQVLADLRSFFSRHPVAYKKHIEFPENYPKISINIDTSLLSRVLYNMVINALEATAENETVRVWIEHDNDHLSFCVWNAQEIPEEISHRIFQRNFSTKEQAGRGIGTFSMKLFGEKVLGGKISFKSSREEGTTFKYSLPV